MVSIVLSGSIDHYGRLYVNELDLYGKGGPTRILRFQQDGRGRTVVTEWKPGGFAPESIGFVPKGDLYFGTEDGVWRLCRDPERGTW